MAVTQTMFMQEAGDALAVSINDVNQGWIGDCFVCAPIAALALERPDFIQDMIRDNGNGTQSVRLYLNSTPTWITVNDADLGQGMNTNNGGQLIVNGVQEIWPQVIENAIAQVDGGYGTINLGGFAFVTMSQLTGAPVQETWLSSSYTDPVSSTAQLQADLAGKDMVTFTTSIPDSYGLVSGHVYTLTSVDTENGVDYAHFRNPWGYGDPQPIPVSDLSREFIFMDVGTVPGLTGTTAAPTPPAVVSVVSPVVVPIVPPVVTDPSIQTPVVTTTPTVTPDPDPSTVPNVQTPVTTTVTDPPVQTPVAASTPTVTPDPDPSTVPNVQTPVTTTVTDPPVQTPVVASTPTVTPDPDPSTLPNAQTPANTTVRDPSVQTPLVITTLPITPAFSQSTAQNVQAPVFANTPGSSSFSVYRFFDSSNGTQFLTSDVSEAKNVISSRPDLKFEGVAMGGVSPEANDPNAVPLYRFFDTTNGTHFFTASQAEEAQIVATRPDLVQEQGSFYEHSSQQQGDAAVYRFFDNGTGDHFFTESKTEVATISATRADMTFEGVAFYAPSVS
jgi:hypothetical protein